MSASAEERIASAMERIATAQEKLVVEAECQTDFMERQLEYFARSEKNRNHMDALTSLFYIHSFRRDGMKFVQEGTKYSVVPMNIKDVMIENEEIQDAYEKLFEALKKHSIDAPEFP